MTIENAGLGDEASALKSPFSTHWEYHLSSMGAGS